MSRVIVKQMFRHPNFKTTSQQNKGHVKYIATRAGVDKTLGADQLKGIDTAKYMDDDRLINKEDNGSETGDFDYQKENSLDQELRIESDEFVYAKYIDERPSSHGLFGQYDKENLSEVEDEISNVKSFVWRTIISLKEEDAINLGYTDKSKWQEMLRNKMPDVGDMMKIPYSNLRWVGAVHMEKGHPHVHVMYWEKQPRLKHGIVSVDKLNGIRKVLTDEIFREEREGLLVEKNDLRDFFLRNGEDNITEMLARTDDNEVWVNDHTISLDADTVSSRFNESLEDDTREMIEALSENLPTSGRKAYGYMSAEIKEEVDVIVEHVCKQPEFESIISKNEEVVRKMASLYTGKEEDVQKAIDNAASDLKKRFAQIVLKGAFSFRDFGSREMNQKYLTRNIETFKTFAKEYNHNYERELIISKSIERLSILGIDSQDIISRLNEKGICNEEVSEEIVEDAIEEGSKKVLILNNKKEIENNIILLKTFGYTEAETYEILKESTLIEKGNIEKYIATNYYDGEKLINDGFETLASSIQLNETDKDILNKIYMTKKLEEDNFDAYSLIENETISKGLYSETKPFEFITLDKKVADIFLKAGVETDGTIALTEKDIEEYFLDKLAIEHGIDRFIEEKDTVLLGDFDNNLKFISNRLSTLKNNKVLVQDRDTGIYTISSAVLEEIDSIKREFEFGKYDAEITLSHFTDGKISLIELRDALKEDTPTSGFGKYIKEAFVVKDQQIAPSSIGFELFKASKYLKSNKVENIKDMKKEWKDFVGTKNGKVVLSDEAKETMKVFDFGRTMKNHSLNNITELDELLEKNAHAFAIEKQVGKITWRLDKLSKLEVLRKSGESYEITEKGEKQRADILNPKRVQLRNKLKYFENLGYIQLEEKGEVLKANINLELEDFSEVLNQRINNETEGLGQVVSLIHMNNGKLNTDDLKERRDYSLNKSFYDREYDNIEDVPINELLKVSNYKEKSLRTASIMMLTNGRQVDEIKDLFSVYTEGEDAAFSKEEVELYIAKAVKEYGEAIKWGVEPYVSKDDLEELFELFGIDASRLHSVYNEFDKGDFNKSFNASALLGIMEQEAKKEESQNEQMARIMNRKIANKSKYASKEGRKRETKKKGGVSVDIDLN